MECWLFNARHLRNVPARKPTCKTPSGSASSSSRPRAAHLRAAQPIRELRDLTRYRKAQIEERGREAQRLDKVLQDAGIKLSSVATDILGRSGRDMLTALVSGTHDPEVLADLRGAGCARSFHSCAGHSGPLRLPPPPHRGQDPRQARLPRRNHRDPSAEIDRLIAPFAAELELLDTIPGSTVAPPRASSPRSAWTWHACESARLASWAGRCPGLTNRPANKIGPLAPGPKWLAATLAEAPKPQAARRAPTWAPNSTGSADASAMPRHARRSTTPSSWPPTTSSTDTSPTGTSGPTGSRRRPEAHARRLAQQIEALGRVTIEPTDQAA